MKLYFFSKRKEKNKNLILKANNNQTSNEKDTKHTVQHKMFPTHNWTHFEAEENLSFYLWFSTSSVPLTPFPPPTPRPLPLYIDAGI